MPNYQPSGIHELIQAGKRLQSRISRLRFAQPVTHVYNPIDYAWKPYEKYLLNYASSPKRVVFLGMNPGPFGMVQTGIPFGEVAAVKGWLNIRERVMCPASQHPRRPIQGLDCPRSEISGRRLWGLFADRFGTAEAFFREHFVLNYCPLAFLEETGRNRTPDKLPLKEREALFSVCDDFLAVAVRVLQPEWLIGVGDFAAARAYGLFSSAPPQVGRILHPSPANPAANRDWAGEACRQLIALGVWAPDTTP